MSIEVLKALSEGAPAVLAVILEAEGSTPRGAGTKMAVFADGRAVGTVGGGKVEFFAIERARILLAAAVAAAAAAPGDSGDLAEEYSLDLMGNEVSGDAAICGGRVRLVLELIRDPGPIAEALRAALDGGAARVLVFDPAPKGFSAVLDERGGIAWQGSAGTGAPIPIDREAALAAIAGEQARSGESDGRLYDPLVPPDQLLILGAGHVGRALAELAARVGFQVTVVDNRPELADPARFDPSIRVLAGDFGRRIGELPFGPSAYAVVVSPDHRADLECVRAILGREYRYAGFIGSRRKVRMTLAALKEEGFAPERVDALCAPIGLDIGAQTPEEIAVAILAELIAWRRSSPKLPELAAERVVRRNAK
jgi:xanthine dehydrogenase accessory factor